VEAARKIRQGDVYWLDDCEPLAGTQEKRRPVVVVSTPSQLAGGGDVTVVACTTSPLSSQADAIELPNHQRTPQTKSGLPRPTWAVPQWYLTVRRSRLADRAGYITGIPFRRVLEAFAEAYLASRRQQGPRGESPQ
jgi:mRNA-degrading endonuclease toxin of MazEF toxin-antitoxin module